MRPQTIIVFPNHIVIRVFTMYPWCKCSLFLKSYTLSAHVTRGKIGVTSGLENGLTFVFLASIYSCLFACIAVEGINNKQQEFYSFIQMFSCKFAREREQRKRQLSVHEDKHGWKEYTCINTNALSERSFATHLLCYRIKFWLYDLSCKG